MTDLPFAIPLRKRALALKAVRLPDQPACSGWRGMWRDGAT